MWDNIDRLEETLSGAGTSHRVNGIAIQPEFIGPHIAIPKLKIVKDKKRSIDSNDMPLPQYNAGERVGPPTVSALEQTTTGEADNTKMKTLIWIVCRLKNTDVPSWTGFNGNNMSTVFEVLNQSVKIMRELQLPNVICVFDQAMYAKAAEIAWKHSITFQTRQSEMADLARRATRDLSQFHMGGPKFDTGRSWKL